MRDDNELLLARLAWLVDTGRVDAPTGDTRELAKAAVARHRPELDPGNDADRPAHRAAVMQAQRLSGEPTGGSTNAPDFTRAWFSLFEFEELGGELGSRLHGSLKSMAAGWVTVIKLGKVQAFRGDGSLPEGVPGLVVSVAHTPGPSTKAAPGFPDGYVIHRIAPTYRR